MNFYTADLHFGHKNSLTYCNRPFANIGEMNECLIKNWNEFVTNHDTVYVLGDMFFYDLDQQKKIMRRLNGTKILIMGNHDIHAGTRTDIMKLNDYIFVGWEQVCGSYMINNGYGLVHDPAITNIDSEINWLCGHVHGLFRKIKNVLNVGVDVNDYKPLSQEQIDKEFRYAKI